MAFWVLGAFSAVAADPQFDAASLEFFEKEVRPILVNRCYECHSDQTEEPKGGLRVDSRSALLAGGETGPAIDLKAPQKSLFLDAINYGDLYQMPPKSKMPTEEIATLTRWVELGAPWPTEDPKTTALARQTFDLQARKAAHWAWRPVQNPTPPQVQRSDWPRHPLDAFILAKLEENGLSPAPDADRRTLIRRLSFDLIGLPPTPEEVAAFVEDEDPRAVEKLVDRLLDSPHFGERWGRHWLDLVRYAESRGHEFDYDVPEAWRYRDYVIRALNADVPYDQWVIEHFAGDLLDEPRLHPTEGFNESILGTGFWFFGEWVHSPVDIRLDETDRVDNQLDVASKTFLAMTLSCARCHDHKFDAISQRDYYAMAGFLQSSSYRQARFQTEQQNRRIAAEWETLQQEARPSLVAAFAESRRPVVDQFASYLLAARDALAAGGDPNAVADSAAKRQVAPELLSRWVAHLREAAKSPRDPFHAWAVASRDDAFAAAKRQHLDQAATQQRRVDEALSQVKTIIDYGQSSPSDWIVDGPTFGGGPVLAGTAVLGETAESPLAFFAEYSAARRDPLWNGLRLAPGAAREPGRSGGWVRAGRTIRTPTFTIEAENVYYLVRGSAHIYAVVDSHRVNNGPLHGSLVHGFQNIDTPRWVAHHLGRYRGHRAHVEFSARDNAPLEVLMVVQGDQPPGDPLDRPNALLIETLAAASTPDEWAQGLQSCFQEVLNNLSEGQTPRRPQPSDVARLANWLRENPELTINQPTALDALHEAGAQLHSKRSALAAQIREESHTAPAMWDGSNVDEYLLIRGNPKTVGDPVPRRFLEAIVGDEPLAVESGSGRLELARQIASPDNPLTGRVMVNRVWHHLFGRGIVASVDNFGVLGEAPTHPELLDYLTTQFVTEGWSIKRLIRSIVLSRTYQMASVGDPTAIEKDPANLLLHQQRVRRLQGEAIRDAILALSGRLDRTLYGPSVPVHLTPFMQGRGRPGTSGPLDGAGRRSIYGAVRRNFLSPMMQAFDTPPPFSTMGRRNVSNVPAQALILMNDPFVVQQARIWAERELADPKPTAAERVQRLYLTAYARPATSEETAAALAFLEQQALELGISGPAATIDVRVWADLCHVLINAKEFIFIK